jgi:chaperonin cofactor prefoldin
MPKFKVKPGSDHELSEKIRQLEEKLTTVERENERLRAQLRRASTIIHAQHDLIMDYGA